MVCPAREEKKKMEVSTPPAFPDPCSSFQLLLGSNCSALTHTSSSPCIQCLFGSEWCVDSGPFSPSFPVHQSKVKVPESLGDGNIQSWTYLKDCFQHPGKARIEREFYCVKTLATSDNVDIRLSNIKIHFTYFFLLWLLENFKLPLRVTVYFW